MESRGPGLLWGGVSVFLHCIVVNDSPNCILLMTLCLRLWADRWTVLWSFLLGVLEQNHEIRKIRCIGAEESCSPLPHLIPDILRWLKVLMRYQCHRKNTAVQHTLCCVAWLTLDVSKSWHINAAAAYFTVQLHCWPYKNNVTCMSCLSRKHCLCMLMHNALWGHPLLLGMSPLKY